MLVWHWLNVLFHEEPLLEHFAEIAKPPASVSHRVVIAEAILAVEDYWTSAAFKEVLTVSVASHADAISSIFRLCLHRVIG